MDVSSAAHYSEEHAIPNAQIHKACMKLYATLPDLVFAAKLLTDSLQIGTHPQKRKGTGDQFWQHKPYEVGDPLRNVDWKKTAKSADDSLYILEKEQESASFTSVILRADRASLFPLGQLSVKGFAQGIRDALKRKSQSSSAFVPENKLELMLLIAATMMLSLHRQKLSFALICDSPLTPRATYSNKETHILDSLQNFVQLFEQSVTQDAAMSNAAFMAGLEQSRKGHIILIDDFWSPLNDIERALGYSADRGTPVTMIHPITYQERRLDLSGNVIFENTSDHASNDLHAPDVESLRQDYCMKIENHLDALKMLSSKMNIRYSRYDIMQLRNNADIFNDDEGGLKAYLQSLFSAPLSLEHIE